MRYEKFEDSFKGFFARLENITNDISKPVAKSESIRAAIAETEFQLSNFKSALSALKDPTKAVSLATMLTDCDIKLAQLQKDLEQEIIVEKGTKPFTNADMEFMRKLFGDDKQLQAPATRQVLQQALRQAIQSITIDVRTQSYKVTWKNSTDVHTVKLIPQGHELFINDKLAYRETDPDIETTGRNKFPTTIEKITAKTKVKDYLAKQP